MYLIKLLLIHNFIHRQNDNLHCLILLQMLILYFDKNFTKFDYCKLLHNEF